MMRDPARIIWVLAIAIAIAAYGLIVTPNERVRDELLRRAHDAYDEVQRDDGRIRHAAMLRAARARVAADLRRLSGPNTPSGVTAAALRLIDDEAGRRHVEVRAVLPESSVAVPNARDSLDGQALRVDLRGRFEQLVALLADLPRHDVLVEVQSVDLTASGPATTTPLVDATLHATVDRVRSLTLLEEFHASVSSR